MRFPLRTRKLPCFLGAAVLGAAVLGAAVPGGGAAVGGGAVLVADGVDKKSAIDIQGAPRTDT